MRKASHAKLNRGRAQSMPSGYEQISEADEDEGVEKAPLQTDAGSDDSSSSDDDVEEDNEDAHEVRCCAAASHRPSRVDICRAGRTRRGLWR